MKIREAKDRGIMFSAPMVLATMRHEWKHPKRETRRGIITEKGLIQQAYSDHPHLIDWVKYKGRVYNLADKEKREAIISKWHFQKWDRLWIKETFAYGKDGRPVYRATDPDGSPKWKSAMLMPKVNARFWHQLVEVDIQKIGQIDEAAVLAEGVPSMMIGGKRFFKMFRWKDGPDALNYEKKFHLVHNKQEDIFDVYILDPVEAFISLWKSIHGPDSWNPNIWVWVYRFNPLPSIFTIGDPLVYDPLCKKMICKKRGKYVPDSNDDPLHFPPEKPYRGGTVWKNRFGAEGAAEAARFKVYRVLADWDEDTEPDQPHVQWHNLLKHSPVVPTYQKPTVITMDNVLSTIESMDQSYPETYGEALDRRKITRIERKRFD